MKTINDFNFKSYLEFCKDFKLKASQFKNLLFFKRWCYGEYEIIFSLI